MEQSILTPDVQRWVSAIVKLTSLTYANKLIWVKRLPNADAVEYFPGVRLMSSRYNADLEGQRFQLTIDTPEPRMFLPTSPAPWSHPSEPTVSLQVFDAHGSRVIDVPNLSVLQPLANAVQSQADSREEGVLSAIEKAQA